ncbi:hypothetical protein HYH03_005401 [Edaphochlamys debaryana]|uniref:PIG-P domain-containing protein n=1 Tax=Edaphochlamys debaryana TaxID=47281 RepID=A0A835YFC7_9CHLO|nr:hypothetical protein HYH03_005401 [Edaphochlamys debaryana]|eukprot:KAG2496579.1 hypothetical protein HYH03_005401 [Edaphochlamys debaryana]
MAGEVEVRGFALMLAVRVLYVAYLAWLFVPETMLHRIGVTYYPSKHWALAGPAWLTLALVWGWWMYEGYNMTLVTPLTSRRQFEDSRCKTPISVGLVSVEHSTENSVPPLCHIPPAQVSRALFGRQHSGSTVRSS